MGKILQIEKLYDSYKNIIFGYTGIDLETGKMRYFFHYDTHGNYDIPKLFEFNIANYNKTFISDSEYHSYSRPYFSSELPNELRLLFNEIIDKHRLYNKEKGYSISNLDFNRNFLSIQHNSKFSLLSNKKDLLTYNPRKNIINMSVTQNRWLYLGLTEREELKENLINEIGHMKATEYLIDDNNKLTIYVGFNKYEYMLKPIILDNDDIFYMQKQEIYSKDINNQNNTLEEIINNSDCANIFLINGKYNNLGNRINNLCDGKLYKARYRHDIDYYYDSLCSIMGTRKLAIELLDTINSSIYGLNKLERKIKKEEAEQLIKRYEKVKKAKIV